MIPAISSMHWEVAEGLPVFMAESILQQQVQVLVMANHLHSGTLMKMPEEHLMKWCRWVLKSKKNWEWFVRYAICLEVLKDMAEYNGRARNTGTSKLYSYCTPPDGIPHGGKVDFDGAPMPTAYDRDKDLFDNWKVYVMSEVKAHLAMYPTPRLPWLGGDVPRWVKFVSQE